ncbi:MAG: arginine deiminase family protein [Candidatus Nanopelagicales bacterium]
MTNNSAASIPAGPGWGTPDMVSPLRKVFVRTPTTVGDFVGQAQWREPDRELLLTQHAEFVALLESTGAQVLVAPPVDGLVDSVYTHDPAVMTPFGAILLRMRKPIRSPEPAAMSEDFERMGVPVLGSLTDPAFSDGGDKVWLDERTLVVGRSYRTNAAAIAQFRDLLSPHGVDVISVDLPHYLGPDAVLHLMSVISPIAHDLSVVFEPLAPVALLEILDERGIKRVTVDEDEMLTQGANILAVAPGEVVLAAGNDKVRAKLEAAGVKVHEFAGTEVAVKGDGGPTCLTQPLWRE